MQGIEFEDNNSVSGLSTRISQAPAGKPSFMMRLLAKVGITDKATANFVLLGIAVLFFAITIFLYANIFSTNPVL